MKSTSNPSFLSTKVFLTNVLGSLVVGVELVTQRVGWPCVSVLLLMLLMGHVVLFLVVNALLQCPHVVLVSVPHVPQTPIALNFLEPLANLVVVLSLFAQQAPVLQELPSVMH